MNLSQHGGVRVVVVADSPLRTWAARSADLLGCNPLCSAATVLTVPTSTPRRPIAAAMLNAYLRLDRLLLARRLSAVAAAPSGAVKQARVERLPDLQTLRVRLDELAPQILVLLGSHSPSAPAFADLPGTEVWVLRHGAVPAGRSDALLREFVRGGEICVTRLLRRDPGGGESTLY